MKKILVTGGNGRFATALKEINNKYLFNFRSKKQLNILSIKSIEQNVKKFKPKIILHLASLSRPMKIHEKDINKSIDLNIIGTSNIVKICNKYKIKLIFFQLVMSIKEKRVITKKMMLSYLGTNMAGLN